MQKYSICNQTIRKLLEDKIQGKYFKIKGKKIQRLLSRSNSNTGLSIHDSGNSFYARNIILRETQGPVWPFRTVLRK